MLVDQIDTGAVLIRLPGGGAQGRVVTLGAQVEGRNGGHRGSNAAADGDGSSSAIVENGEDGGGVANQHRRVLRQGAFALTGDLTQIGRCDAGRKAAGRITDEHRAGSRAEQVHPAIIEAEITAAFPPGNGAQRQAGLRVDIVEGDGGTFHQVEGDRIEADGVGGVIRLVGILIDAGTVIKE